MRHLNDEHMTYWDKEKEQLICVEDACELNVSGKKKWKLRRKKQEHNVWLTKEEDMLQLLAQGDIGRIVLSQPTNEYNAEADGWAWWNGSEFVVF